MSKHTAFISVDGLSDPLGQSQILPYVIGLAAKGYAITVFSCEKEKRLLTEKKDIELRLQKAGVQWQFLLYDENGSWLSRWQYTRQLKKMVVKAHTTRAFALSHCRSYQAALVGLYLKRKFGLPYLFDMRGFWANERVDGGIWKLSNPIHLCLFLYFKYQEKQLLKNAAAINSLTENARQLLAKKFTTYNLLQKTVVTPCCTNTALFNPATTESLPLNDLANDTPYLVYHGSIGTWYFTAEVIACFEVWKKHLPNLRLLLLTKDTNAAKVLLANVTALTKASIVVQEASHKMVAAYLKNALAAIFFIKPAYSKIASSPTKMAECWAMGLPIITNKGIGDNDLYFQNNQGGVLISEFTAQAYEEACLNFLAHTFDKTALRTIAVTSFDHRIAIENYSKVYERISS